MNSIVKNVASACLIIRSVVGQAAQRAIQWIPIFNLISFVISFLSLRLFVYSTHQARKLFEGFNEAMKEFLKADKLTDEVERNKAKAEALDKVLTIIDKEGIDPLRKQLMLSKKAREELDRRVQNLGKHIKAQRIGAKDEELMRILVGRAKTQLGFRVADLAASVAGVAAGVLIVAPVPVVGQIVGLSVFAATGAVSLVSFGARYFLINKNPFDTESHSRAVGMLNTISKTFEALKQRLSRIGKRGLPQTG